MLILYNKSHAKIKALPFHQELQITQEINVKDEIRFKYPISESASMTCECYIRTPDGKNLFDKDMAVWGNYLQYTDGSVQEVASGNWHASDYINVEPSTTYIIRATGNADYNNGMAFYDSAKTYISGYSMMEDTSAAISFTTPSTCKFMRFGFNITLPVTSPCTLDKVQLELGSEPTTYEAYKGRHEFVIKEMNIIDDLYYEVIGKQNLEDFTGTAVREFINYTTPPLAISSATATIQAAIDNQANAWTLAAKTNLLTKTRKVDLEYMSVYEVLTELADIYFLELRFDPVNLIVTPFLPGHNTPINRGAYYAEELNLKSISVQTSTYEYYTKLIPIGTDASDVPLDITGLGSSTFHDAGDDYIYDKSETFSEKVLTKYYVSTTAKTAQDLLDDAESEFLKCYVPQTSYSVTIFDLCELSGYSFLLTRIGDEIGIMADTKNINENLRIVKYTRFFDERNNIIPDKSTVEISTIKQTLITLLAGR